MHSPIKLYPIKTPRSDTLTLDALTRFMAQSGAQPGIGSPSMNFINGAITDSGVRISDNEHLPVNPVWFMQHAGREVIYGIRPENIALAASDAAQALPLEVSL